MGDFKKKVAEQSTEQAVSAERMATKAIIESNKSMSKPTGKKMMHIQLSQSLYDDFEKACAESGDTVSYIVRKLMQKYIETKEI